MTDKICDGMLFRAKVGYGFSKRNNYITENSILLVVSNVYVLRADDGDPDAESDRDRFSVDLIYGDDVVRWTRWTLDELVKDFLKNHERIE